MDVFSKRIATLQKFIAKEKLNGVLLSNSRSIYYFSGVNSLSITERDGFVLVTRDGASILLSSMFIEQASETLSNGLKIIEISKEKLLSKTILEIIGKSAVLGYQSSDLKVSEFNRLKKGTSCRFKEVDEFLSSMREVKDEEEIEFIKKAVSLTDQTYEGVIGYLKSLKNINITEAQLAEKVRQISYEVGGEGLGFDSIVAFSANAAKPHHIPGETVITEGILLFDLGIMYKGYTGDLTRCISVGRVGKQVQEMYDKVRECNEECISECSDLHTMSDINKCAVEYFKRFELDKYFIHSIGHGVGLDIHEGPSVSSDHSLQFGNVITIEPGLYFANEFGIRIEDMVLIQKDGCRTLNRQDNKRLINIPSFYVD